MLRIWNIILVFFWYQSFEILDLCLQEDYLFYKFLIVHNSRNNMLHRYWKSLSFSIWPSRYLVISVHVSYMHEWIEIRNLQERYIGILVLTEKWNRSQTISLGSLLFAFNRAIQRFRSATADFLFRFSFYPILLYSTCYPWCLVNLLCTIHSIEYFMLADQAFASAATECLCDITDLYRKLDDMLLMMKKKYIY